MSKTIPKLPGATITGHLKQMQTEPLNLMLNAAHNGGPITQVRFLWIKQLILTDPDYIQHILQNNARNYRRQSNFSEIVKLAAGESLFTSEGEDWLWRRRLMQPAFHRKRIAHFAKLMSEEANQLAKQWANQPADIPIDVGLAMMDVTMQIIGQAMFTINIGEVAQNLHTAFATTTTFVIERAMSAMNPPIFLPLPSHLKFKEAVDTILDHLRQRISERRQETEPREAEDLLDMLLSAEGEDGRLLTDQELVDEMSGIVFAGHETTATTLTWAWYLISKHPEVEQKLHQELDSVLQGATPTLEDLPNLPYTQQIIQETLRLYPPAWITNRESIAADEIDGYQIPAKTPIIINFYALHRHPDYWENPDQFYPERFAPDYTAKPPKFAYLPFGAGPRKCIGDSFALMEAPLILATLAQKFRLRHLPDHHVEPFANFILEPKPNILVTIERR